MKTDAISTRPEWDGHHARLTTGDPHGAADRSGDPGISSHRAPEDPPTGVFGHLKLACEFLEGCSMNLPAGWGFLSSPWVRGLWWAFLLGVILLFCGQTSKFIYIDF